MLKNTILLLAALVLLAPPAFAAVYGISNVSVGLGYIETFHRDDPEYTDTYAFYPELQISGPIPVKPFFWVVYGGYWDDGVDSAVSENYPTYSYKGGITGVRLLFKPAKVTDNWPLPAGIFAGYSRHFITMDYVGGGDPLAPIPETHHDTSNTFEFGLNITFPLRDIFVLKGEVRQFVPFSGDDFEEVQKSRRAYTIGVSASF